MSTGSVQTFVVEGTYPKVTLAAEVMSLDRRDAIRACVARIEQCGDASVLVDSVVWASST